MAHARYCKIVFSRATVLALVFVMAGCAEHAANRPQPIALSGAGTIANPSFSPPSLSFGRMLVGTTSRPTTVTLTNPNVSALKITSIATTKPYAVSSTTCLTAKC